MSWQRILKSLGRTIRFNPWSGCQKVHTGCLNCYAESHYSVKLRGITWGSEAQGGKRVKLSDSGWKEPVKWNRWAAEGTCPACGGRGHFKRKRVVDVAGTPTEQSYTEPCGNCGESGNIGPYRARIFSASLADIFEDWRGPILDHNEARIFIGPNGQEMVTTLQVEPQGDGPRSQIALRPDWRPMTMGDLRARLFHLIDATPNCDWLVLTKRPSNIPAMIPANADSEASFHNYYRDNLWLGTSISDQSTAEEWLGQLYGAELQRYAPVRFLSIEPMTGPVSFRMRHGTPDGPGNSALTAAGINWVIVGGESGSDARPCHIRWVLDVIAECKAAGVPVFLKQFGRYPVAPVSTVAEEAEKATEMHRWPDGTRVGNPFFSQGLTELNGRVLCLNDDKGGDMDEWPSEYRVREFPITTIAV